MDRIQYSAILDPVIYSEAARNFTRNDWLELAKAALDQALHIDEEPIRQDVDKLIDGLKD